MPPENDSEPNNGSRVVRKRMLLSEVYVHKKRRRTTGDIYLAEFEVFHIYEVVDDNHTFIQPRLATNCNEREEVIDALNNVTGSDTPPIQRLIKKLTERSELIWIYSSRFSRTFSSGYLLFFCFSVLGVTKAAEKRIKNEPIDEVPAADPVQDLPIVQCEPADSCTEALHSPNDLNSDEHYALTVTPSELNDMNIADEPMDISVAYNCEILTELHDTDATESTAAASEIEASDDFIEPQKSTDTAENVSNVELSTINHPATSTTIDTLPISSADSIEQSSEPSAQATILAPPTPVIRVRPAASLMQTSAQQPPAVLRMIRPKLSTTIESRSIQPKPAEEAPTIIQPRLSGLQETRRPFVVTEKSMTVRMMNGVLQPIRIVKAIQRMSDQQSQSGSASATTQQPRFIRIQGAAGQNTAIHISNGQIRCIPTIKVPISSQSGTTNVQAQPKAVQATSQPAQNTWNMPRPKLRIARVQSVSGPAPSLSTVSNGLGVPKLRVSRVQSICGSAPPKLPDEFVAPASRIQTSRSSLSPPHSSGAMSTPLRRIAPTPAASGKGPTILNGTTARVLNGSIAPRNHCHSVVSLEQLGVECDIPKRQTMTPQIEQVFGRATKIFADARPVLATLSSKLPTQKSPVRSTGIPSHVEQPPKSSSPKCSSPVPKAAPSPVPMQKPHSVDAAKTETAIPVNDKLQPAQVDNYDCLDLRCNICLYVSSTPAEFEDHMIFGHNCDWLCSKCHKVFASSQLLTEHRTADNCAKKINADRPYVCIISAPIILSGETKSGEGASLQCKYCPCVFDTEKEYVQHAQRHATRFRCKLCTSKDTLDKSAMRAHLQRVHSFKGIY